MTTKWDSFSHSQMETLVYPKTFGQYIVKPVKPWSIRYFLPMSNALLFWGDHWTIYCTTDRIDMKLIPTFFWNRC